VQSGLVCAGFFEVVVAGGEAEPGEGAVWDSSGRGESQAKSRAIATTMRTECRFMVQ